MNSSTIREHLRETRFLTGLTDTAIHQLAKLVTKVSYAGNQVIFEEGAPREVAVIIHTGAVAIEKNVNGRPVRLVTLGPGDSVGEGLLLDETPHGTTARTLSPTDAYVLTRERVQEMVKENATLYAALVGRAARAISQRLAATDATLVGRGRTLSFGGARFRMEKDLLGEREVPEDALYGVQTLRALENFPISGTPLREFPSLIEALAAVKEAAAQTNADLGLLPPELCRCRSCARRARSAPAGITSTSWST